MSEQRGGTGTGVWTHPAASPPQPEQQRCECPATPETHDCESGPVDAQALWERMGEAANHGTN